MGLSFQPEGVNDMTTAPTVNTAEPTTPEVDEGKPNAPTKPADKPESVTLDQLAREMKVPPRDARMLLRLAAKQTKLYPTLGKEHVARQPWSWTPGSKALAEARKALAASTAAG
jgi:hypothetical protein